MPAIIDLRLQGHTAGLVSATGQLLLYPAGADGEAIPLTNVCTDATSLAGQIDARIAELERPKVVAMLHFDLAKAHYELVRDVLVLRPARPVTAAANAVEEEHADAAGRFRC